MEVMSDRDVGELWKEWGELEGLEAWPEADVVCPLIRKLVHERARNIAMRYYRTHELDSTAVKSCEKVALREFNIPAETWKE